MNTETHTELRADLDKMKKATQAVYLACEASVADNISAMLKAAIDEIERLRNQLAALPDDNRASEDGRRAAIEECAQIAKAIRALASREPRPAGGGEDDEQGKEK